MYIPKITINDELDICVYFCFILSSFGRLSESVINEIVLSVDSVNYFDLISATGFMEEKNLITSETDKSSGERYYCLLPDGKKLSDEFYMHIPLSVREKTLETGNRISERLEREKSVKCDIIYDSGRKRYDLDVKFLNEINGETILEIKLFAPDEQEAEKMKRRFLSKPSLIITRTMNMFLKDDFFMFDK